VNEIVHVAASQKPRSAQHPAERAETDRGWLGLEHTEVEVLLSARHSSAERVAVGSGFVASLARPGGNITGFAVAEFSMYGKSLEMLKEVAPDVTRVAVLLNPEQVPQAVKEIVFLAAPP
jgi:hypothetical protein